MFILRFICTIYTFFFAFFFFLYCMYFEKVTLSDFDIWKSLTFIKFYYLRKYIFKKISLAARSINNNCDFALWFNHFRPYDSTIFVHTMHRIKHAERKRLVSSIRQRQVRCIFQLSKSKWAPRVTVLKTKTDEILFVFVF